MTNALVPLNNANLPAAAQKRMASGQGIAKNLTEGAGSPIDILSIKGKNFTERVNGDIIQTPRPMYEYDAVILDGTPGLSKTYFIDPFQEGSMSPPDCWSLNGIKPDPSSPHLQSPTCRGCKWNVFGSRISTDRPGQQSKAKACADSRRVAILPANRLTPADGSDPAPMLLRIPATSLQGLKVYAQELERMGIPANAVVTRLGFDTVAHPQLTFTVAGMLNDAQFSHIEYLLRPDPANPELYLDERVRRILEAPPPVEDIDPSEVEGMHITNRNQAPVAQPQAVAQPGTGAWVPGQPQPTQAAAIPHPQTIEGTVGDVIINLPDGRKFNQTKGVFVEAEPEVPVRPATVIDLPDGKHFDTATGQYWVDPRQPAPQVQQAQPVQTETAKPISERAKADPPPANTTSWKPADTGVPGPGWKPPNGSAEVHSDDDVPDFLKGKRGPVIDGTTNQLDMHAHAAAVEAKPAPKTRKPVPPTPTPEAVSPATEAAAGDLDAMLSGLDLGKK